jgi:proteasome lid subunit RPN8/RPN11
MNDLIKTIRPLEPVKQQVRLNLNQPVPRQDFQVDNSKQNERKNLALRFSPTAWAKMLYFRDRSDNEIGGFGISEPDDLLFVRELATIKQEASCASVKFDDEAVSQFFDQQVDLGRRPEQFARIWAHSHPGDCPQPSSVDEETFARVFNKCQWAVMCVVAQNNKTYARISFNVGPGGQVLIPVEVEFACDFGPTDKKLWEAEYQANIKALAVGWQDEGVASRRVTPTNETLGSYAMPYDFIDEFERMEPAERQCILDELAGRPDLWDQESEVMAL